MRLIRVRFEESELQVRRDPDRTPVGGISEDDGRHEFAILAVGSDNEFGHRRGGRSEEFRVFVVRKLRGFGYGPCVFEEVGI